MCKIEQIQKHKTLDTVYTFEDETIIVKQPFADNSIQNYATVINTIKDAIKGEDNDKPLDWIYDDKDNVIGSFDRKVVTQEKLLDNYQYNILTLNDSLKPP